MPISTLMLFSMTIVLINNPLGLRLVVVTPVDTVKRNLINMYNKEKV